MRSSAPPLANAAWPLARPGALAGALWSCFLARAASNAIAIVLYFPPPPTETAGS
jgi:hypothetical protein